MPFNPSALKQAANQPGYDEPPPPDDYEATLYKSDIFESKAGETFVRLTYRVVGGQLRDHEWSSVHSLEEYNRQGDANPALPITARVLGELGVDIDSLDSTVALRKELDKVEGGVYMVEVKRNGQYVNTTPKRTLEQRIAENTASAPPAQVGYGEPPASASNGDPPASDVTPPPLRGDIDPETGEPIPF